MTTHTFTNSDEVPAQPTVRSAWDAVRGQGILLGTSGYVAVMSAATGTVIAVDGPYPEAWAGSAAFGVFSVLAIAASVKRAQAIKRILSNIPAPKP